MKLGVSTLLRLGLGLTLAGCAAGDALEGVLPEEAQEPIIGGTETTGDPAVGAILAFTPGETQASLCTATLITPTVMLTAAHCVDPAVVGAGKSFEARFGPDLRNAPADMRIPVKSVHWDTAFSQTNLPGGHDIAVAILERTPPGNIKPIPYIRKPIPANLVGTQIRVVGFGLNSGFDQEGTSAGIKREAKITFASMTNLILNVGTFGLTICSGDSGGPGLAMVDGVETVIGVNSYGIIFCLGQAAQTNVASYTAFIDQYTGGGGCTPVCNGKECGSDGCGGDCGRCDADETCTAAGQCEPAASEGCPAEDEGNDDASQANELCDGNAVLGTISGDNDDDWYTFEVKPSTTYTVLLDNVSDDYELALYKKSKKTGNLMTVGPGQLAGGNKVISRRTSDGGTYYVRISGRGVAASNQYGVYVLP